LLREQTQDMGVILVEQCWEILNFGLKRVIVCSVFKPFRNGVKKGAVSFEEVLRTLKF